MFKNDERYWDINLLNKWFAISSVVFLLSMIWTFIDDNDDEFKDYQKAINNCNTKYKNIYGKEKNHQGIVLQTSNLIQPKIEDIII